jgi:hypothetical protein
MQLQFGKYKGQEIEEVPISYLKWLEENCDSLHPNTREAIQAEIKIRTADESSIGKDIEGPSYTSYEEMLYTVIRKWLVEQHTAKRLILLLNSQPMVDHSLAEMLKVEVPKIKKQYKSQRG